MSDRVCIRGCTVRDVHFATCRDFGLKEAAERAIAAGVPNFAYVPTCKGCAPRECRDGSLICDACFGRASWLVDRAPELLVRIRTKADPRSARAGGEHKRTRPVRAPDVVDPDFMDAIIAVQAAVGTDVRGLSNDAQAVAWLGYAVLDRHPLAQDGTRDTWSMQDVMDRWGLEDRPEPHRFVFPDDDVTEVEVIPVREWFDPLVTVIDAARMRGVNERTARKWVTKGLVGPVARRREGRTTVTSAHASRWFAVRPCLIGHPGAWCTRVDGHEGDCVLRPGERPKPRPVASADG